MPQLLVMAMPLSKTLTKVATRTNWISKFRLLPSPAWNTSVQISDQDAKQNGSHWDWQCRFQDLDQTNIQQFGLLITRFQMVLQVLSVSSLIITLKTDFSSHGSFSL